MRFSKFIKLEETIKEKKKQQKNSACPKSGVRPFSFSLNQKYLHFKHQLHTADGWCLVPMLQHCVSSSCSPGRKWGRRTHGWSAPHGPVLCGLRPTSDSSVSAEAHSEARILCAILLQLSGAAGGSWYWILVQNTVRFMEGNTVRHQHWLISLLLLLTYHQCYLTHYEVKSKTV